MKWLMKKQKKRRMVSFFWVVMNFTLNMAWLLFWIYVCCDIIDESHKTGRNFLHPEHSFLQLFAYTAVCFIAPIHAVYWIWIQWRCCRNKKYLNGYPTLEVEDEEAEK